MNSKILKNQLFCQECRHLHILYLKVTLNSLNCIQYVHFTDNLTLTANGLIYDGTQVFLIQKSYPNFHFCYLLYFLRLFSSNEENNIVTFLFLNIVSMSCSK
jgi:hypothetical protein